MTLPPVPLDLEPIKEQLGHAWNRGLAVTAHCKLLIAEVERLRGELFSTEIRRSNAARGYLEMARERDELRLQVSSRSRPAVSEEPKQL